MNLFTWSYPTYLRVIIETPSLPMLTGPCDILWADWVDVERPYAMTCLADSLQRGEAPFLSHLLYTDVVDSRDPEEHALSIQRAREWYEAADMCAVYLDLGISGEMQAGINVAEEWGIPIIERRIHTEH